MGANSLGGRFDLLTHPIEFVTASGNHVWTAQNNSSSDVQPNSLSGDKAKKMYEDIINEKSSRSTKLKDKKVALKRKKYAIAEAKRVLLTKPKMDTCSMKSPVLARSDLFKAAQSGNLETVKKCIEDYKLDINTTDDFSWTPLMMAAHAGHFEVVSYLLMEGAQWIDQADGSGYDARDLACLGGHTGIADVLMNSERHVRKRKLTECKERVLKTIKREKLRCELCKCDYYAPVETDMHHNHFSSTLHLFNDADFKPPCQSHFYISGSNKGYQLLKKDGWDEQSGLGPDGEGQKYPVKTVLKRDRLGLGSSNKNRAKVTHFGANDSGSVRRPGHVASDDDQMRSSRTMRKRKSMKKDEEDKQKEMDFRRLFY